MRSKVLFFAGLTAMMMAACSNDDEVTVVDPVDNGSTTTLELINGSQESRVTTYGTTSRALATRHKLQLVAKIAAPEVATEKIWSATSVLVNGDKAYISWHSDYQASTSATAWGGAIDEINLTDPTKPSITTTATSDEVKFNNLLLNGSQLFAAGGSYKWGGVVARINLTNGSFGTATAEMIGFPGSSVNALAAQSNSSIYAISGYTGTEGSFSPTITATNFNAENPYEGINCEDVSSDFGGKYVTVSNGTIYTLYQPGSANAQIKKVSNGSTVTFTLDTPLVSDAKYAETYTAEGGWSTTGTQQTYYGKHVLAVSGNYAYVGAGKEDLRVYDVSGTADATLTNTYKTGSNTTGVCVADGYVYAATGAGLRVYTIEPDGQLDLYAFEMETYDDNGLPVDPAEGEEIPAKTGTADRHSCNFVTVSNGYIYVAYGQSGVRVYKFRDEEETPAE